MIITRTPLRVSFLGGNTDFKAYYEKYGGVVLSATIDKYIYCIVRERFDNDIWVNCSIKEKVQNIDDLQHELVREAMRKTGVDRGVEISFLSDIPSEGSGLGSSSSVTVGVLNALYSYTGRAVEASRLAEEACEIEIDILKKGIGVQDQYIAAYGGLKTMFFEKDHEEIVDVDISNDKLDQLNSHLMMFYTGKTRSASAVLANMDVKKASSVSILDDTKRLALEGAIALEFGYISDLGFLLDQYWALKKSLNAKVTDSEIDDMYFNARRAGALGGKILGAGAGGFLLLMVLPSDKQNVRSALQSYREMPFRIEGSGSKVIFNI